MFIVVAACYDFGGASARIYERILQWHVPDFQILFLGKYYNQKGCFILKTLKDTKLTEIDIAYMEIRIESLMDEGDISPFAIVGGEIKKYAGTTNPAYLPTMLKEFFTNEQIRLEKEGKGRELAKVGKEELGQLFWNSSRKLVEEKLCSESGYLYKIYSKHGEVNANALVVVIASSLDIGGAFTGLLSGVALIVISMGLDNLCQWGNAGAAKPKKKAVAKAKPAKQAK